ncbi:MAG TPA: hypothetical protein VLD67_17135 [Vicinamibacterales bacterium]|nr:hypothetical protein [Vicinamibacterales bacterium]
MANSVIQCPEGVTLEYAHEQFTVWQHIFVPLDEPVFVMLLEVDAIRPARRVEIVGGWDGLSRRHVACERTVAAQA